MSLQAVADYVRALPEVTEGTRYGNRTWFVAGKGFAWERPLSKADIKRFGDEPIPQGPLLAVMVADLDEKEAVLAEGQKGVFTIQHFQGYPAVLIQLALASRKTVKDLVLDGWLACAPAGLAKEYLASLRRRH